MSDKMAYNERISTKHNLSVGLSHINPSLPVNEVFIGFQIMDDDAYVLSTKPLETYFSDFFLSK